MINLYLSIGIGAIFASGIIFGLIIHNRKKDDIGMCLLTFGLGVYLLISAIGRASSY